MKLVTAAEIGNSSEKNIQAAPIEARSARAVDNFEGASHLRSAQ